MDGIPKCLQTRMTIKLKGVSFCCFSVFDDLFLGKLNYALVESSTKKVTNKGGEGDNKVKGHPYFYTDKGEMTLDIFLSYPCL